MNREKAAKLKPDRAMELFPKEISEHSLLIQSLSKDISRRRLNPKNFRKFESDIQYSLYPDFFPKKLSLLLRESLICFEELENDDHYEFTLSSFHSVSPLNRCCCVDLVGCLMAVRYRFNYTLDVMPYLFLAPIASKFEAITLFSSGKLSLALSKLFFDLPDDFPPVIEVPSDKTRFKEFVKIWISKLEQYNL